MTTRRTAGDFDIRLADPRDDAISPIAAYAFDDTPRKPPEQGEIERWQRIRRDDRIFLSYRDGDPIAKTHTLPMTMNVRGTVLPMGGVSGVACMPAGRRSGHIRALLEHSLTVMREDGQPVSALYPFRESFYERFGFAGWTAPRWITVDPAKLGPILRIPKQGTVRQRAMKDGFADWIAFMRERQAVIPGFSLQGAARGESWVEDNDFWVTTVHEGEAVTGAMIYKITDNVSTMSVASMLWSTVDAQYGLLDFIARHVDQVERARAPIVPGVDPAFWLTDAGIAVSTDAPESWGAPMGRIVSLEDLRGIGAGDGEVSVRVTDPQCPWNDGIWTLRGVNGTLDVERGASAQAELTIQALSALVLAGMDPSLFRFRGWGAPDEATIRALRALFPPIEPFIFELF